MVSKVLCNHLLWFKCRSNIYVATFKVVIFMSPQRYYANCGYYEILGILVDMLSWCLLVSISLTFLCCFFHILLQLIRDLLIQSSDVVVLGKNFIWSFFISILYSLSLIITNILYRLTLQVSYIVFLYKHSI